MKHEHAQSLTADKFRRLTGIQPTTFKRMVEILTQADISKNALGGRPSKLCIEDRLLMTLEYLREYRTYFHISQSFGVSESSAFNTVKWVESTLVKHPDFALPGRKALLKSDMKFEVVLIDATETPVERPKKSNAKTTQEKRNGIP